LKQYHAYKQKLIKFANATRAARNNIAKLHKINAFLQQSTVDVPLEAWSIANAIIEIPSQPGQKRSSDSVDTKGKIRSLLFPVFRQSDKRWMTFTLHKTQLKENGPYLLAIESSLVKKCVAFIHFSNAPYMKMTEHSNNVIEADDILKTFGILAQSPQAYFKHMGDQLGMGCWCHKPLSDEESIARGYGAICARWIGQLK
jgi:hypothetical protein